MKTQKYLFKHIWAIPERIKAHEEHGWKVIGYLLQTSMTETVQKKLGLPYHMAILEKQNDNITQ